MNQSGHSVHSHQSLNQSFNSSYNSPSSNHHQGHNASSHSLTRNHAASPSTSSSNLYHTHYATSSNQNHSSGAAPVAAMPLQNSVNHQERRRNASSPYVNSVASSAVHGQHGVINQAKGGDRTTSSSNYRQYAGGVHSSTDSHAVKSSHLTTDQHHRLYSQSKQATGEWVILCCCLIFAFTAGVCIWLGHITFLLYFRAMTPSWQLNCDSAFLEWIFNTAKTSQKPYLQLA